MTGTIHITAMPREYTGVQRFLLTAVHRTHGGYTTCTGMYGNSAVTGMEYIRLEYRKTHKVLRPVRTACFAVGAGTALRGIAAQRTGTTTVSITATTVLASAWFASRSSRVVHSGITIELHGISVARQPDGSAGRAPYGKPDTEKCVQKKQRSNGYQENVQCTRCCVLPSGFVPIHMMTRNELRMPRSSSRSWRERASSGGTWLAVMT